MKTLESAGPKQSKKVLKIEVEKRRRERINQSLEELRTLLLESTRNDRLLNPRMEKADILDFTVQYLKTETFLRTRAKEDLARKRYEDGFRECLHQATGSIKDLSPSTANQVVLDFNLFLADGGKSSFPEWRLPLPDGRSHHNWTDEGYHVCKDSSRSSSKMPWPANQLSSQSTIPSWLGGSISPLEIPLPERRSSSADSLSPSLASGLAQQRLLPQMMIPAEKPIVPQSVWRPWP
ncbi:transcription factor HES-7-like [Ambystoma mexicanum]|uniref:transcription factor HES-7-like n=1 Tax=Ambystoma mexicanum TaxID=8296 RepID=UPI0037E7EF68